MYLVTPHQIIWATATINKLLVMAFNNEIGEQQSICSYQRLMETTWSIFILPAIKQIVF